jgi:hypothetical protein
LIVAGTRWGSNGKGAARPSNRADGNTTVTREEELVGRVTSM